uniref:Zinc finger protein 91-like n=1 Tax=Callorhinchus milii TaxID=7868 RepID=A0A4W3JKK6_CALMI
PPARSQALPLLIESEAGCERNGPEDLVLESDLMLGQELEFEDCDEKIMGFEKDSEDSIVSEELGLHVNGNDEFPPSYKRLKTEDETDSYMNAESIDGGTNTDDLFIPFSCQQCGSLLDSNPQQLDRVTGPNCPKCSLDILSEEISSEQMERLFCCQLCSFTSQYPNHLARHMKTHSGEKPYKCKDCHYASAQLENLKRHMRTHTGEKPFKCKACDYACSNMRHILIHTGERPFKCDKCPYNCSRLENLKRHNLVKRLQQTGTCRKAFRCGQCPYFCRSMSSLKWHMQSHTGGEALAQPQEETERWSPFQTSIGSNQKKARGANADEMCWNKEKHTL